MNEYKLNYIREKILEKHYFKDKNDGFFVDIGSYDGIEHSSTYLFEKKGWKGVCCDPIPEIFSKLMENRPNSSNINCAVTKYDYRIPFILNKGYTNIISGVEEYYNPRKRDSEINIKGGFYDIIKVISHPLQKILDHINVYKIDYLTISTEGSEFSILQSIDFDKTYIDIIDFVDLDPKVTNNCVTFLKSKGYKYESRVDGSIIMIKEDSSYN